MGLDNLDVVDAVGIDAEGVVLNLFDHWDWEDEAEHLYALQNKLNAYLGFVDSGQIYDDYPLAVGRTLRILIIHRCPIPAIGLKFLERAKEAAAELDMTITHELHEEREP